VGLVSDTNPTHTYTMSVTLECWTGCPCFLNSQASTNRFKVCVGTTTWFEFLGCGPSTSLLEGFCTVHVYRRRTMHYARSIGMGCRRRQRARGVSLAEGAPPGAGWRDADAFGSISGEAGGDQGASGGEGGRPRPGRGKSVRRGGGG